MIGLLSSGAVAQVIAPATNPPATASPANATPAPAAGAARAGGPGALFPFNLTPAEAAPSEPPDKKQFSPALAIMYAQGISNHMAGNFRLDPKEDLDLPLFIQTFSNYIAGVPTSTNMAELSQILHRYEAYQSNRIMEEISKLTALGPTNKVKGEKFMDGIAQMPGVAKLASGVVYKVIKDGDGDKPLGSDVATLSFRITDADGAEVWKIEHTPVLVSNPLLPIGIREVLLMMKAGSHWTIYLPYQQAYGEKPGIADLKHGFKVGPFSALVFDMEVEKVLHQPAGPMLRPPGMSAAPTPAPAPVSPQVTSSSIVMVPSAEGMARGEKPRVMTDAEVEAAKLEAAKNARTNFLGPPAPK
jgi:FKBP-type peptidyl-prolyl cis-trans isomerase